MDRAVYWATKSPLPEFWAITFEHPAFDGPFFLVANVFEPVTLGGNVHRPVAMTIKPPDNKGDAQPRLTVGFPRQVVGREFKQQLALIVGASSRTPITVTFAQYLGVTDVPQATWVLYASDAGGVSFTADQVQVTATLDNPLRRTAAVIYDPAVWTGLQQV